MKWAVVLLMSLAIVALGTPAQQPAPSPGSQTPQAATPEANPVANAARKILERQAKNIIAAAEEMPPDKYTFHPTADQIAFGKLIAHITDSNNHLCSLISGGEAPKAGEWKDTDPKEKIGAALKSSFDYCTETLAKLDDSKLGEQISLSGGRTVSRAFLVILLTDDFADHYSSAAAYLRLNNLVPPTAQPRKN